MPYVADQDKQVFSWWRDALAGASKDWWCSCPHRHPPAWGSLSLVWNTTTKKSIEQLWDCGFWMPRHRRQITKPPDCHGICHAFALDLDTGWLYHRPTNQSPCFSAGQPEW